MALGTQQGPIGPFVGFCIHPLLLATQLRTVKVLRLGNAWSTNRDHDGASAIAAIPVLACNTTDGFVLSAFSREFEINALRGWRPRWSEA